ncbi:MAG: prepilin-type N-terminal cleavage/methylation domain-containing protein, partial [Oscillospiraceae bacterium]|nr:prepilin-type N-terminal cleavage/methylation domain-containing protein [Oscillospiraceae bacterium]
MNINENNKRLKGFTLVEIIVVLVILAVLATAMIPALTGYIDKAKEKTAIAEARNIVTAAQT